MSRPLPSTVQPGLWRDVLAAALISVAALVVYSNSFTGLFLGVDGKQSIRDNPHITKLWPISEAISLPMWDLPLDVVESPAVVYRPVFSLSLALTNVLVGRDAPAHHAVNLAIHLAAALALFLLVRRTWTLVDPGAPRATWSAFAAALIWVVHPLQTESVTYIAQRSESLMGLLLFLTMYCAIRAVGSGRRFVWQSAAVTTCLLGTGSKETAALAPLLVWIYDFTFFSPVRKDWSRLGFYLALIGAASTTLVMRLSGVGTEFELERYVSYALSQPGVVLHYVKLALWPDDLFLYVNTHLFQATTAREVLVPLMILVPALVYSLRSLAQRHWIGFVGAWFFVTLAPASSFLALTDRIQEHRMYVPLAALAVLAVIWGRVLIERVAASAPARGRAGLKVALLMAVVLALGARTYARNQDYHQEFAAYHPEDLQEAYASVISHYQDHGMLDELVVEARAILANPGASPADLGFAHLAMALVTEERGDLKASETHLRSVVKLQPDQPHGLRRLAELAVKLEQPEVAADLARRVSKVRPFDAEALVDAGIFLAQTGALQEARTLLERAVELRPTFTDAHVELGSVLLELGEEDRASPYLETAAAQLERTIERAPRFAEPRLKLGMVLLRLERKDEARAQFEEALRVQSDLAEAHHELGVLLRDQGELDAAKVHLQAARNIDPGSKEIREDLNELLALPDPEDHVQP